MKSRTITFLIIALSWGWNAFAAGRTPWPKRVASGVKLKSVEQKSSDLPKGLHEKLLEYGDTFGPGDEVPETLDVTKLDLNDDTRDEFIIASNLSYTGGTHYFVFQEYKGQWRSIADFQGWFFLCERANGYYQFEVWRRSGSEEYTRTLERFRGGQYHISRDEDYRGEEAETAKFVRARNPQEYQR